MYLQCRGRLVLPRDGNKIVNCDNGVKILVCDDKNGEKVAPLFDVRVVLLCVGRRTWSSREPQARFGIGSKTWSNFQRYSTHPTRSPRFFSSLHERLPDRKLFYLVRLHLEGRYKNV